MSHPKVNDRHLGSLSTATATEVRAIVEEAFGGQWTGFESYVTAPITFGHHEWRFGGQLGFGGKLRVDAYRGVYVDCYPEDLTPALGEEIARVNTQLAEVLR